MHVTQHKPTLEEKFCDALEAAAKSADADMTEVLWGRAGIIVYLTCFGTYTDPYQH